MSTMKELIKQEIESIIKKHYAVANLEPDWIDMWQDCIGQTEEEIKRELWAEGYKFSDA